MRLQIDKFLTDNHEAMIDFWRELVNTNTIDQIGKKLTLDDINRKLSWKLDNLKLINVFHEYQNKKHNGEYIGIWNIGLNNKNNKKPIIFLGHVDTIFPVYTPFYYNDLEDTVIGSGVLDMKGGIVIMIYTALALMKFGYDRPIKMIITSQEETGHVGIDLFKEFMIEQCKDGIAAFSFETASSDHSILVERAAVINTDYEIIGKTAHTGRNPEDGIDAINIATTAVQYLLDHNHIYPSTNFRITVGTINGGIARNVICDKVTLQVDTRLYDEQYREQVLSILNLHRFRKDLGKHVKIKIQESIPAMLKTEDTVELYKHLKKIAEENDITVGDMCSSGGAGDAAYAVLAGIPTLDQMGVEGEFNHTKREYARVNSLFRKTRLAFLTTFNISKFEVD